MLLEGGRKMQMFLDPFDALSEIQVFAVKKANNHFDVLPDMANIVFCRT